MITTLLIAASLQSVTLRAASDAFVITGGGQSWSEPYARPETKPPKSVIYRKDEAYVVWDARGLVLRHGKVVKVTRLPDIALTPKLFTPEEITATKAMIASGARKREAESLAGSLRIGDITYWLVRWSEKGVGAWLEALVKVDLSEKPLTARLVGRFEGLSLPGKAIDNRLLHFGGQLTVLTTAKDGSWGIAAFTVQDGVFRFARVGERLREYEMLNPVRALVQEATTHGTRIASLVDLQSGGRNELFEFRGKLAIVQPAFPALVKVTGPRNFLRNLDTGSQTYLPGDWLARGTSMGVVAWPVGKPQTGILLDPERWRRLAAARDSSP
ncbi:MAG TPA: hypothetical protein VEX38_05910 [Fimbriimonadaceae bacterium]|nr:hypothetical protein [Fimbriimonadaceae bacterium]